MDAATTIESNESAPWDGDQPSWQSIFYGILTDPVATYKQLDLACDYGSIYKLCTQAFNTVFLSACLLGLARITPSDGFGAAFDLLSAVTNEMIIWVFAAALLSLLSVVLSNARSTKWKKALVITGWSFVPIIFFAPLICFKNALGAMVLPFVMLPTWWSFALLLIGYKVALGISGRKLLVLVLVIPPLLFLCYAFWTGLSLIMMLTEIISAFSAGK